MTRNQLFKKPKHCQIPNFRRQAGGDDVAEGRGRAGVRRPHGRAQGHVQVWFVYIYFCLFTFVCLFLFVSFYLFTLFVYFCLFTLMCLLLFVQGGDGRPVGDLRGRQEEDASPGKLIAG